jgi:hypothetical protein
MASADRQGCLNNREAALLCGLLVCFVPARRISLDEDMRRGAPYDRIIRSMASGRLQQQEELLGEHSNDVGVIDPVSADSFDGAYAYIQALRLSEFEFQ